MGPNDPQGEAKQDIGGASRRGSGSGRSIRVSSGVEPSAALRMRHHDVPVDEWV